jgi:poly-beta-1,6-N-acetyl-D-glucosamine synthase
VGGVSVLIAAHNEAGTLPRKLESLLELAKADPIREIWIGLDGCTDGTAEVVRRQMSEVRGEGAEGRGQEGDNDRISSIQYPMSNVQGEAGEVGERSEVRGQGSGEQSVSCPLFPVPCSLSPAVYLLEFDRRRGKAAVLNDLMGKATQPFLVMMDARQRVEAGAISRLLENFADPQVGVVSGALVYESAEGAAQQGAQSYWGYETLIRRCESRYWAVPGATGALYAIRRGLCGPIPDNTLVDDVLIPMRAVLKGYRCLFEPLARVMDRPTADFGRENIRKRRTLAGIWQLINIEPKIYSPVHNPAWFQWMSHKFLRLLTPLYVLAAVGSAGMMVGWKDGRLGGGGLVFLMLVGGVGMSGLAYGAGRHVRSRGLGLLGAFWGVNQALVLAAWDAATGRWEARWARGG